MAEGPGQENRDAPSQEDNSFRGRLIGFAIAGAILGAILLVVFLWVWVHPTDPTEKKDFIQAVGVLLAALAALGGLYFTRKSTKDQLKQARENTEKQLRQARKSTEDQLEQARENTEKQLQQARKSQEQTQRLTEQGQITDRFTRAIDQLGKTDDKGIELFEIRLGGIYALERIATESKADYWPIMEILTAYVRKHAPWPPEGDQQAEMDATVKKLIEEDAPVKKLFEKDTGEESEGIKVPALAPDVQAIMTVLRRRSGSFGHGEPEPLDLRKTHLSLADLSGANLHRAKLYRTNLRNADLSHQADLSHADLSGANLVEADLSGANLHRAALRRARLCSAHFDGAGLRGADLTEADLSGADLSLTRLSDAQVEKTYGDEDTKLPPYLEPPAHWVVNTDEPTEGQ